MSYQDTQQKIQKTLTGRNSGTQITPDSHQNMAETMLNYIQEVENISVSCIEGIAYPDTEPLQPDAANVVYISAVPSNTTYTYKNFADENGDAVSITATTDPLFVILFWNKKYWSYLATTSAPHLHVSAELTDSNDEVPSSKAVNDTLQDIYKRSNPNDDEGNIIDTNTIFAVTNNDTFAIIIKDLDGKFLGGFEKKDGNFVFVNKVPRDIQDAINASAKQLQTADQTLQENIDAEGKARQTADQTLQENIDAEGKARQTADQTLQENIDAKIQAEIDRATTAVTDKINDINASNVKYNHNDSQLDATNVQQAVDEMRELINTHEGNIEELQDSVNEINKEIQDGPDDFSIQDEAGNILCLWKDGHIKTKNFDSEKVATKEEVASIEHPVEVNENPDSDLDVADENGNVLARFKDGHIKTKNFDSEKVATKEEFSKIKFVAFGDSITDSDTSIGSCLGDVICNFLGTKRINNWARGNATMSDYSSITDGIRNNITPINLAYPPNSTVPYNVISNQVLRMLQWTTPLNKQIEWVHNIDGRFSINTSYGTGLGHTSDIPDIIYIAGGTNDTKDSYRWVDDTETVFGQTYSNLTRITIASALRWIIETLQSVYPLAHIFVASPLQTSRGWNWDSNGYTGLRTQSTWQVRQIIEKVTRFESVHFIDSYSESGFNNLIATKVNDGIHPKGIWRDAIAKYVSNEIKNKYYNR